MGLDGLATQTSLRVSVQELPTRKERETWLVSYSSALWCARAFTKTYSFEQVDGVLGDVGRETQFAVEDLLVHDVDVLRVERRLREHNQAPRCRSVVEERAYVRAYVCARTKPVSIS